MDLLLKGLMWRNGPEEIQGDIRIKNGVFFEIARDLKEKKGEMVYSFSSHFAYPGLINAHDHLEMNLYPKLGKPYYKNYTEWASDIYKPRESPIREIEKLSITDRLLWGGLKNLIGGVTTVIHHNPWHRSLESKEFPIKVLKKIAWSHSLAFGKKIEKSFPSKKIPFVIHAGEGVDEMAAQEILKLNTRGLLKENTVLIHAVALNEESIEATTRQRSSIIWCPSSNLFMFGQTCPIKKIIGNIKIALGSDCTLTGSPTMLDEIKMAAGTTVVNCEEIFKMTTAGPAQIFNLPGASIHQSLPADLFITPIKHRNYFENLIQINPSNIDMVIINGKPKLIGENLSDGKILKHVIKVQDSLKHIEVDVSALMKRIKSKVDSADLEKNPLWNLIQ